MAVFTPPINKPQTQPQAQTRLSPLSPKPFQRFKQSRQISPWITMGKTYPPSMPTVQSTPLFNKTPYNPFTHGKALLRAGLLTAGGFVLAFTMGRRLFKNTFKHVQGNALKKIARDNNVLTQKTTFLNLQNPILSLMTMVNKDGWQGVALMYGIMSIGGYLASTTFKGLQASWVRHEETQLRMKALTSISNEYAQSITEKETYLQHLKQRAAQSIQGLLTHHRITQPEQYTLGTGIAAIDISARNNFLQEVRREAVPAFNVGHLLSKNTSSKPIAAAFGKGVKQQSLKPSNVQNNLQTNINTTPKGLNVMDPFFVVMGGAFGLVAQGAKQTWKQLHTVLNKAEKEIQANATKLAKENLPQPIKRSLNITLKDTEALAMLMRDLKNPRLIIGMGLITGLVASGKLLIDGLREIKVYQQNAKTEVNYQRFNWRTLGFNLQKTAEETWLNVQLNSLNQDLPALKKNPEALKQRINSILGHIGLNSPPTYYTTPLEFNEPYYWHYSN